MLSRLSVIGEIFRFMSDGNRKFWLLPLVLSLAIAALLILAAGAASVAPFLYPLF